MSVHPQHLLWKTESQLVHGHLHGIDSRSRDFSSCQCNSFTDILTFPPVTPMGIEGIFLYVNTWQIELLMFSLLSRIIFTFTFPPITSMETEAIYPYINIDRLKYSCFVSGAYRCHTVITFMFTFHFTMWGFYITGFKAIFSSEPDLSCSRNMWLLFTLYYLLIFTAWWQMVVSILLCRTRLCTNPGVTESQSY